MTRPIFGEMREWSLYQPVTVGPVACVTQYQPPTRLHRRSA